jgi:predicted dienelactone hydrolase
MSSLLFRGLATWGSSMRSATLALTAAFLSACSFSPPATWDERHSERLSALAAALPMPGEQDFAVQYFDWVDDARPPTPRAVPAKLYLPKSAASTQGAAPLPLIVFSHGLGGSREGYTYLGKYWAQHGYASLHVQHVGSDRSLWSGSAFGLVGRLQHAAQAEEAQDRALDVRFALDRLLADPAWRGRIDVQRIGMAGHSYGANTALLLSGATPSAQGRSVLLRDERIRASVLISAPPFYGSPDQAAILQSVRIPTLHITATQDDITIPGFFSNSSDRMAVYQATGSEQKALIVFSGGSHSVFTDRLNTGGQELNPKLKLATRSITLAFFEHWLGRRDGVWPQILNAHQDLLASVVSNAAP